MSEDNPEEVIVKKLDKVADSLENTTSQLSSVVTQQQLDLLRERVAKVESDLKSVTDDVSTNLEAHEKKFSESTSRHEKSEDLLAALERDHAALRALIYSSFVLSTLAVIGLVIFSIQM